MDGISRVRGGAGRRTAFLCVVAATLGAELPAEDCDGNGQEDAKDIAEGRAEDCDWNGVPDTCDLAPVIDFPAPRTTQVEQRPYEAAAGDFDEDGRLDVAVGHREPPSVSVLRGAGDGTFVEPVSYAVSGEVRSMVAHDIDADGHLDLVTGTGTSSRENPGAVSVLRGRGDASFEPAKALAAGNDPESVAAADLDGDGWPDLVTANDRSHDVAVLLGTEDGFAPAVFFPVGREPHALAIADLDADGVRDLVTSSREEGVVDVLRGRGDGSFLEAETTPDSVRDPAHRLLVADVDGDSLLDAVTLHPRDERIAVRPGRGDGTLDPPRIFERPGSSFVDAAFLELADSRRLLVLDEALQGVRSFRPDGEAYLREGEAYLRAFRSTALITGDWSGDGHPDIVLASSTDEGPHSVQTLLGTETGGFATARVHELRAPLLDGLRHMEVVDFDHDGQTELAAIGTPVTYLEPEGAGGWRIARVTEAYAGTSAGYLFEDLDGDGVRDFLAARRDDREIWFWAGKPDGSCGARTEIEEAPGDLSALSGGDVDGDGRTDVLYGHDRADAVTVIRNDPEAGFIRAGSWPLPERPTELVVEDLDGDGLDDVAALPGGASRVAVLLAREEGGFAEATTWLAGEGPSTIAAGDVDGDGAVDLVTGQYFAAEAAWLRGAGDGTFAERHLLPGVPPSGSIAVADIDGNGHLDIVSGARVAEVVSILPGTGGGAFAPPTQLPWPWGTRGPFVVDVDGDGRVELAGSTADRDESVAFWTYANRSRQSNGADCDLDGVLDACAIRDGIVRDVDGNGVPDRCQRDCDGDTVPDTHELAMGTESDCDGNGIIDRCDIAAGRLADCDGNGQPDACELVSRTELDENANGVLDACETDCDGNGQPDDIDIARDPELDCDGDGRLDSCQIAEGSVEDCNDDGRIDACEVSRELSLQAPQRLVLSPDNRSVEALLLDTDSDGRTDAVTVARDDAAELLVHRATAQLGFAEPLAVPLAPPAERPLPPAAGDVDGDGRSDVILVDATAIRVLRGSAGGTLAPGPVLATEADPKDGLAVADFDGDGKSDIAVSARGAGSLLVAFGNAKGELQGPVELPVGASPRGIAAADLDGDDSVDLAVGNWRSNDLSVVLNEGDRTFAAESRRSLGVRTQPTAVEAGDWDGDGRTDLAVAGENLDSVVLLFNGGDATFERWESSRVPVDPLHLGGGDLDGNGVDELVVSGSDSPRAALVEEGADRSPQVKRFPVGELPGSPEILDLDGDGHRDLVFRPGRDLLYLRYGEGDGLTRAAHHRVPRGARAVALGDMDGDGFADLVASEDDGDHLHVFWGTASGELESSQRVQTRRAHDDIELADLDGDGLLDIATANSREDSVAIFVHEAPRRLRAAEPVAPLGDLSSLEIGDLDNDGRPDIVAVTRSGVEIAWGRGGTAFETPSNLDLQPTPQVAVRLVDFDADGRLDIVRGTPVELGGRILVHLQQGDGSFGLAQDHPVPDALARFAFGHLDGDGHLDLITAHRHDENALAVHFGDGAGGFTRSIRLDARDPVYRVVVIDLDENGVLDIAFTTRGAIGVRLGRGDGSFEDERLYALGGDPRDLATGDVDRDGLPELAVAIGEPEAAALLLNRSELVGRDCDGNRVPDACDIASGSAEDRNGNGVPDACEPAPCLVPGDCNRNARLELGDAVCLFRALFIDPSAALPCEDGAPESPGNAALLDWQADARVDVSDGIAALRFLFLGDAPHALAVPGAERTGCVPVPECTEGV